ncbi:MAG TPA: response regulator [Rikenellaceae bacterium]|nr:response regulator [Rikenellaceae bacterium]
MNCSVPSHAQAGYECLLAQDGSRCLSLLEGGASPYVILLDIVMPKMDGLELLTFLKGNEKYKGISVILLSNLGQDTDIKKGMELGALDYMIKAHYTPSEAVKKVEEILNKSS